MDFITTALAMSGGATAAPIGQVQYTTPGTYLWTCPPGVTSVSVVCIGASGGGMAFSSYLNYMASTGGAGELRWKNSIPVTPGNTYTVVVGSPGTGSGRGVIDGGPGSGTAGGNSYFINTSTVRANGGGGATSTAAGAGGSGGVGDGGGNGGSGYLVEQSGSGQPNEILVGGAGAGGYAGSGGNAYYALYNSDTITVTFPSPGGRSGAGGGGGGSSTDNGGGTGLLGQGSNGAGSGTNSGNGGAGSGGSGTSYGASLAASAKHTTNNSVRGAANNGVSGAVRIIWGDGRSFPSTNTGNL